MKFWQIEEHFCGVSITHSARRGLTVLGAVKATAKPYLEAGWKVTAKGADYLHLTAPDGQRWVEIYGFGFI